MAGNFDIWHRLTAPSAVVPEPAQRRLAQLLAATLLILMPMGWIVAAVPDLFNPNETFWTDPEFLLMLVVSVINLGLYLLSRSRHYRMVPFFTILLACTAIWIAAIPNDSPRDMISLYYLLLPIFLSALFFSIHFSVIVIGANVGVAVLFALLVDEIMLPQLIGGPMSFLIMMAVFGWLLTHQYSLQQSEQHRQRQAAVTQLRVIYELTAAVNRAESLAAIYDAALQSLLAALSVDRAAVLLIDDDGVMRFKAAANLSETYQQAVSGHSPWPLDAINPEVMYVPDAAAEPSLAPLREPVLSEGIRSIAFVPLLFQGKLLGKFMLYWDTLHAYDGEEIQIAQTLATNVSFAMARKQSEQTLAQQAAALSRSNSLISALGQVAARIQTKPDLPGVLQTLGDELESLELNCWVGIRDVGQDYIRHQYSTLNEQLLRQVAFQLQLPLEEIKIPVPYIEQLWSAGFDTSVYSDQAYYILTTLMPGLDEHVAHQILSKVRLQDALALLPLVSDGVFLGVLAVWGVPLRKSDMPAFSVFATQLAETIQTLRLFQALQAQKEQYRLVSELVSDWAYAFRVDADGSIVREWTTDAFRRVTGREPEEFRDSWINEIVHPQDREIARGQLQTLLQGQSDTREYRILNTANDVIWLRDYALPEWDPDEGRVVRILGAAQDITELQQTKERMIKRQKAESLGLMAAGIAHDFNNLLVSMLGQSSIALAKTAPDAPARVHVQKMVNAAERAADLTRKMLDYSGGGFLELTPLDLVEVVTGVRPFLQEAIRPGISLHWRLDEGLPLVKADAAQLQRIIKNLVTNSVEAIERETGNIWIETQMIYWQDAANVGEFGAAEPLLNGRYVVVSVRDDGCGMDEKTRSKVFDPFFSTKFTGRGLGLAAVLGIVQAHDGAIRLQSRAGRGSQFDLFFPALAQDAWLETAVSPSNV